MKRNVIQHLAIALLLTSSMHALAAEEELTSQEKVGIGLMHALKNEKREAWAYLLPEAKAGNVDAMFHLGQLLIKSPEYEGHLKKAAQFFEAAAKRGHKGAAAMLENVRRQLAVQEGGSVPTIGGKSALPIDEMNMVGQFGLDLSNMTCSGVRNLADRSHEEKLQAVAEADCTANAGFKDPKCMAGDGIQDSLINVMADAKNTVAARASSLMGTVSNATGGFIKPRSAASGTGAGGAGTGSGAPGTPTALPGKSCVDVDPKDGTTPLILGASEMNCKDIKKYAQLLPTFIIQDDGSEEVKPRAVSIELMSKQITQEHMGLMKAVYESDPSTFTTTPEYKNLVNRADIVISREELLFMKELARKSPGQAQLAIQQLSTLSMLKELEIIAAKVEAGVYSGLANQADNKYLSDRQVNQYGNSISLMRKEIDLVRAKIQADRERSMALQSIANSMGK